MTKQTIPTICVYGFLGSGKTTYILDCIKNDFFYKRGKTLIIVLEEGELEYDLSLLSEKNTELLYYEDGDWNLFLEEAIAHHAPDRIYIEMNGMQLDAFSLDMDSLKIQFSIAFIDGSTLSLYYRNLRQQLQDIVQRSQQIIFNRCELDTLKEYGNLFKVMNGTASYLWEAPMGYHEKAFGILVPFNLEQNILILEDKDMVPFLLDAKEAPDHYAGKEIHFLCQVAALPSIPMTDNSMPSKAPSDGSCICNVGRKIMTCCALDMQFLSLPCYFSKNLPVIDSWISLVAFGRLQKDAYGQSYLELEAKSFSSAAPPKTLW